MTMPLLASARTKLWLIVGAALLVLLTLVWLLGGWIGARGADLWVLRLGLAGASTALAVGVGAWLQTRLPKPPPDQVGGDELDTTMATARARLAASRAVGNASLRDLPAVLVVGRDGTAKTSSVVNSGLNPDLLAGEVFHGDRVAPTGWVNLWYSQQAIVLEVGGKVLTDEGRWGRFLRYVRPSRLKALLPGRAQASRVVLVCFSCDELLKPGSATAVPSAAAELRKSLVELAQAFAIRLPVYVLFTKADRIGYFAEYMRNLSREEVREVLGATLTWPPALSPGLYGEREFQRISAAFEVLSQSLAEKRAPLLARERDSAQRGDLYEFPREFRKIIPVASQFLLELCRPSQLQVNPVLRGFYFTGVRPVVVRDGAVPAPAQGAAQPGGRVGATQVFNAQMPSTAAPLPPVDPGGHKVPEWLFLGRLFREILLGDRVATVAALGSLRVNLLRRVALSAVAGFAVLWLLGQPISCANNRALAARAIGSLRNLQGGTLREGELPGFETLRNLDTARAQLERLADYERDGAPLRLRFGLYQGSELYALLGKTYLKEFERILMQPTRDALRRSLRVSMDSAAARDRTYQLLRAYVMVTERPDRVEASFLTPVLLTQWRGSWQVDSLRRALAENQFQFYAAKLCPTGACEPGHADQETLDTARNYLKDFTGPEALYQQMISKASGENRSVRFTSASALIDVQEVPGAFTPGGWESTNRYLRDDDNFLTEDWVLQQRISEDPSRTRERLRGLYRAEYVRQWSTFLDAAAVPAFDNRAGAAARLKDLAAPQASPLVGVLALVARNTDVDPDGVRQSFQAVRDLAPPGTKDSASEQLKPYFKALLDLQVLVEEASRAGPADMPALTQKIADANREARTAAGELERSFGSSAPAVAAAVGKLLRAPIDRVDVLMRGLPGMALNASARKFCEGFDALTRRFPFNAAGVDADLRDFAAIFQPVEGELWRFYDEALQNHLVRSGFHVSERPGAGISQGFIRFFNRAAAISAYLWKPGNPDPQFDFVLFFPPSAESPRVTLDVSGQHAVWAERDRRARPFLWTGNNPGEVIIGAQFRGADTELRRISGTWGIFRLFRETTAWSGSGGAYTLQFNFPDRGLVLRNVQLNVAGETPILRPDFFGGLKCVERVTR